MYKLFVKRLLDLIIAIICFPFFVISFLVFAPIIKLTDRGPVFYNANRIGKNGKLFKMYKFRSMYVNAPDIRLSDGSTYNGDDDPRVTKIGRFLRSSSLDELPQLINIINGTMSLIGPRPDPPDWIGRYPEDVKIFLSVRPGLTGYNQAYYRNEADGEQKMINDAFYAQNVSFSLDFRIFIKTIITVISHKGTYKDTTKEECVNKTADLIDKR